MGSMRAHIDELPSWTSKQHVFAANETGEYLACHFSLRIARFKQPPSEAVSK